MVTYFFLTHFLCFFCACFLSLLFFCITFINKMSSFYSYANFFSDTIFLFCIWFILHVLLLRCSSLCSSLARLPRSRPVSGAEPCGRLRGLSPGQVGVCRARGEVMESVRKAAEMVIEEVRKPETQWLTITILWTFWHSFIQEHKGKKIMLKICIQKVLCHSFYSRGYCFEYFLFWNFIFSLRAYFKVLDTKKYCTFLPSLYQKKTTVH